MTDAIVQWLLSAGEGKFLATVLISMLPVIELRGGLPAGVAMGLPLREAFFTALLKSAPLLRGCYAFRKISVGGVSLKSSSFEGVLCLRTLKG